jgi:glycosyltransferase involved in cell wall biosynthesis
LGDDLKNAGAERAEMEASVRARGLTDRFVFLGFRHDAPEVVQAFDVIAVPSHLEPLGLSSLEAMAVARPVVAAHVGGIPEVVVHGETGTLIPPRDARALAGALEALLRDPGQRARFGKAGRDRAAETFGLRVHARGLTGIYEDVVSAFRRTARVRLKPDTTYER